MTWRELPKKLRVYIVLVTCLAVPLVIWAIWDLAHRSLDPGWIVLTLLTVLTVPSFWFLPSVNTIVGIGDAYVMAIAMIYGPSACVIATLGHSLSASLFVPRPKVYLYRVIFNVSSTVCIAWVYSNIYRTINPTLSHTVDVLVLSVVVLTLSFFLLNSLSTATAISWASGERIAGSWGWNKLNKAKAMEAEKHLKEQEELYLRTVESLGLAVDAKDQTTYGHIQRVRAYAMGLARFCGIKDKNELMAIETGSLLHDIGKLAIDDYILNKPGKLSKQEFEKMKMHAPAGHEILQQIKFPFPVAEYVRYHHELWDGSGYPDGLKGEAIPLGARIISISDAFDAIRSARPYKLSFNIQNSTDLLRAQAGTMYDPHLVEIFVQHLDELEAGATKASEKTPQLAFRKYFEKVDLALASDSASAPLSSLPTAASAELVSLYEFCHSFGRNLDLPDALPIVARRLRRLVPFTTIAFFIDDGENNLKAAFVSGKFSDVVKSMTIGLGKGISGWVAAYRKPIVNSGPALEFQDLQGDFTSLTDALVVPLITEGDCLGTISLYAEAPIFYSQTHLGVLQLVANQVASLVADVLKRARPSSDLVLIDPVTETYRAGYFPIAGAQMLAAAQKSQSPLSLLYVDLKDLSNLISLYGVQTGDLILKKAAELLKSELRDTDVVVRYGHQGFVALLSGVGDERARRYAQGIQRQLRITPLGNAGGHPILTVGQTAVASYPTDGTTLISLLESVQRNLPGPSKPGEDEGAEGNIVEFPPRI